MTFFSGRSLYFFFFSKKLGTLLRLNLNLTNTGRAFTCSTAPQSGPSEESNHPEKAMPVQQGLSPNFE
jgi:hypothetical protein